MSLFSEPPSKDECSSSNWPPTTDHRFQQMRALPSTDNGPRNTDHRFDRPPLPAATRYAMRRRALSGLPSFPAPYPTLAGLRVGLLTGGPTGPNAWMIHLSDDHGLQRKICRHPARRRGGHAPSRLEYRVWRPRALDQGRNGWEPFALISERHHDAHRCGMRANWFSCAGDLLLAPLRG